MNASSLCLSADWRCARRVAATKEYVLLKAQVPFLSTKAFTPSSLPLTSPSPRPIVPCLLYSLPPPASPRSFLSSALLGPLYIHIYIYKSFLYPSLCCPYAQKNICSIACSRLYTRARARAPAYVNNIAILSMMNTYSKILNEWNVIPPMKAKNTNLHYNALFHTLIMSFAVSLVAPTSLNVCLSGDLSWSGLVELFDKLIHYLHSVMNYKLLIFFLVCVKQVIYLINSFIFISITTASFISVET